MSYGSLVLLCDSKLYINDISRVTFSVLRMSNRYANCVFVYKIECLNYLRYSDNTVHTLSPTSLPKIIN